ncbi:MAG: SRPBCC domain-containing protein, partial [Polyangiaceae bacterium]
MNHTAQESETQDIVVDEVFPHAPEVLWKTLTNGELMGRWLMAPTGFAAVKGTRFTFQTTP